MEELGHSAAAGSGGLADDCVVDTMLEKADSIVDVPNPPSPARDDIPNNFKELLEIAGLSPC